MKLQKRALRTAFVNALATVAAFAAVQSATAQDIDRSQTITLQQSKQTRVATVRDIESQTNYKVAYNRRSFNENATVDYGRTQVALGRLLDRLLEGTEHGYSIENRVILIHRTAAPNDGRSVVAVLAERSVRGTVRDTEDGNALEGVKVELLDGAAAATTASDGRFVLAGLTPGNHVLKLTSSDGKTVRYREVGVPTGSNPNVALSMEGDLIRSADNQTAAPASSDGIGPRPKTTAYFLPGAADKTIRAFADEAKTEYTFIPSSGINEDYLPKAAVKTNLLILATTTPNLAVEFALARRWTLDIAAGYNPFQLERGGINKAGFLQPEVRYWFCNRFERHAIGLHGIYTKFNVGEVGFLTTTFKNHVYDGWGAGAGLSYVYHLPMAKRWAWEFTVGAGYVYLEYDKFRCHECDEFLARKSRHYFGPTKAGISLIFMIK